MESEYALPPVELHRADMVELWQQLLGTFQPPPPGLETDSIKRKATAESGVGRFEEIERVEEQDMNEVVSSTTLPRPVEYLFIRLSGSYKRPGESSSAASRDLYVRMNPAFIYSVRVTLNGDSEWIGRVRGVLDPYLRRRARKARRVRILAIIAFTIAPAATMLSIGFRLGSQYAVVAGLAWFLTPQLWFYLTDTWYPTTLLIFEERAPRQPWYIEQGTIISAGLFIAAFATVVLTFVWP